MEHGTWKNVLYQNKFQNCIEANVFSIYIITFFLPAFQLKSQAFLMSRRDLSSLVFLLTHNTVYVHWDESSLPSGNLVKGAEKWMALLMNQLLMAASDSQYGAF